MELAATFAHDNESKCPYCSSGLRRVPGAWLSHDGFSCGRCGEFVDFSRPLTDADTDGLADEESPGDPAPAS